MGIPLNVLLLEDREADAVLILHELRRAGFDLQWRRVDTEAEYLAHLHAGLDVILADYALPQFDALRALHLLQERGLDIPFIIVSGTIGEELAVRAMKQGTADYLIKDRLARLGQAITQALEQQHLRAVKLQAEEALRAKNEEITEMSQQLWQAAKLATVGELTASIAHELNNPLTTVMLRVESLLAQTAVDDQQRRTLAVIAEEVDRMSQLVANLLQFSRRGLREMTLLDVREELDNTLALIQYHLRNHQVAVVRQFDDKVPMVSADRQQLRQVFLNLLTNASDAMPQGGTLTLGVAPGLLDPDGPAVVVTVADTGVGIPPEDMPQVLEPFFTTKTEGKGTGLGLPICRRIIQEHQGTMSITSQVGHGTIIRLTLPGTHSTQQTSPL